VKLDATEQGDAMTLGAAVRHLRKGEWSKAHPLVQDDASELGCWAHGIVHMMEGDLGNARYWYRRAHRSFPRDADPSPEITALTAAIKQAQAQ
jgi:hypothetical protein